MRVDKSGLTAHQLDVMEREILQDARAFHVHDFALVVHEVVDGEIFLQRVINAVKAALLQAREIECRFAKGLAGNGAGVDATAAHMFGALDDGNAFAEVGCLGATLFAGGSASDHDEVESVAGSHESLQEWRTAGGASVMQLSVPWPVLRDPGEVDGRQLKVERTKSETQMVVRKGTHPPHTPMILHEYQKKRLTKFA